MPSPRARWQALVCLLAWSWFVELAQPWFTEIRSRQVVDALGNTVGIIGAYAVMSVVTRVRRARGEAGTFFAGSERAEGVDARER
jgi:VanZ family protein